MTLWEHVNVCTWVCAGGAGCVCVMCVGLACECVLGMGCVSMWGDVRV